MKAPLSLNYTMIDAYQRCPRCFYLRHVMRLPEPESIETGVGIIAHAVLEEFFEEWRDAEADGLPLPGLESLLAMTRDRYVASLHEREQINRGVLDQLLAQMKLLMERLHSLDPAPHILEVERTITFEYELDKAVHTFTAKIDRIDQLPDGGVRIIDYKTGRPSKKHTHPKKDDLQLGIYALALKLAKGQSWAADGVLKGTAEYWVLATGERGSIGLTDLDGAKVRAQIDEAAGGMLQGRFEAEPQCDGPCRLFCD
jgi:RecB family exonuclease